MTRSRGITSSPNRCRRSCRRFRLGAERRPLTPTICDMGGPGGGGGAGGGRVLDRRACGHFLHRALLSKPALTRPPIEPGNPRLHRFPSSRTGGGRVVLVAGSRVDVIARSSTKRADRHPCSLLEMPRFMAVGESTTVRSQRENYESPEYQNVTDQAPQAAVRGVPTRSRCSSVNDLTLVLRTLRGCRRYRCVGLLHERTRERRPVFDASATASGWRSKALSTNPETNRSRATGPRLAAPRRCGDDRSPCPASERGSVCIVMPLDRGRAPSAPRLRLASEPREGRAGAASRPVPKLCSANTSCTMRADMRVTIGGRQFLALEHRTQ